MKNNSLFKFIGAVVLTASAASAILAQRAPATAEDFYRRGRARAAKESCRTAVADFTRAVRLKPDFADAYVARGDCFRFLEQGAKALSDYNQALAVNPQSIGALLQRGRHFYLPVDETDINYKAALADFDRAVTLDPRRADSYAARAEFYAATYNELGDKQKALADLNKAVELEPKNPEWHMRRGDARPDNSAEAVADYSQAIALNPKNTEYLYRRVGALRELGEYEKALADCDAIIALDRRDVWAYTAKAEIYVEGAYFQKALAEYAKAMRIEPKNFHLYRDRAQLYLRMGETRKAAADERTAKRLQNALGAPVMELIQSIEPAPVAPSAPFVEDYEEAAVSPIIGSYVVPADAGAATQENARLTEIRQDIERLGKAIRFNPQNHTAYAQRADNYRYLGEYDRAAADYTRALELKKSPDYLVNRGIARARQNDFDAARRDFEDALKIEPNSALACFNLAVLAFRQDNRPLAVEHLAKAVKLDAQYVNAYLFRAKIHRLNGDAKLAAADEQAARDIDN